MDCIVTYYKKSLQKLRNVRGKDQVRLLSRQTCTFSDFNSEDTDHSVFPRDDL